MNIGMLWFDNDPKTPVAEKIAKAAQYYKDKYGAPANLVFIHPKTLEKMDGAGTNGIEVRSSKSVLPNHFWIGREKAL